MRYDEYNLQEMTGDEISNLIKIFDEEDSQNKKVIDLKNFEKIREARILVREATQIFDESANFYALRKRQASQILTIYEDILTDSEIVTSEQFRDEVKLLCKYLHSAVITLQQLEDKAQKNKSESKPELKTLEQLITHINSKQIVEEIKIQYENIGGKRLKLLFITMREFDLVPDNLLKFHNVCTKEFDWNIKRYEAFRRYEFNDNTDIQETNQMRNFFEKLTKV